jgi:hypothetical protein
MISTHEDSIHENCLAIIQRHNYVVSVHSEPRHHTTSSDGFIFAHRTDCDPIFYGEVVYGRKEIAQKTPTETLLYLSKLQK